MIVWQKSALLIKEIYRVTGRFLSQEKFGLVSQLRRASVSVISNIPEGEARKAAKEKRRFYEISRASLVEIDVQIEIPLAQNFIAKDDIRKLSELTNECFAMLRKLKTSR